MQMNSSIPLQGQQVNLVNALRQGHDLGRRVRQSNIFQEHGEGIAAGNQQSINALAQFDPTQALAVRGAHQDMVAQRQRMSALNAQQTRAAEAHAAKMSAHERLAAQEEIQQGLMKGAVLYQRGDLAGLNQLLEQAGHPPVRYVEEFLPIAAQYEELYTVLKRTRDFNAPLTREGKLAADRDAGRISQDTFDQATAPKGPLVQNIIGGEGPEPSGDSHGFTPTTDDLPDGAGRASFGFGGALRNTANAVTDFVAGTEVFPETGEATRYFRDLEENGLVGIAQAYPRMPASQLMERLRRLLPNVGTIEGAQAAYRELVQMQSRFERDLKNATRMQGRGTAAAQAETARRILALQGLVEQTTEGKRLLKPAAPDTENTGKTRSGIGWSVVQ